MGNPFIRVVTIKRFKYKRRENNTNTGNISTSNIPPNRPTFYPPHPKYPPNHFPQIYPYPGQFPPNQTGNINNSVVKDIPFNPNIPGQNIHMNQTIPNKQNKEGFDFSSLSDVSFTL